MITDKIRQFRGKNTDLKNLSQQIIQLLQSDGYKTQSKVDPKGIIIQAQKAGILRDIITADRAFTILITGQPDDFFIRIGVGKWIQNIAVIAVEALLISWAFLAIDVPEMLWTQHIENKIIKKIIQIIG